MLVGKNLLLSKVLELLMPLEAQLGRKINPTCMTRPSAAGASAIRSSIAF
jgi:hypothetical protein